MSISSTLINWYLQKKRNLPWRNTSNPYHIWISEIILQQTRVAQGLDYYNRFVTRFPDIKTLANAELEEVLKVWQGLGYYSRARNLHAGAEYVVQQLNGIFPTDYSNLLKIKGVGEYTAAAIGSFAFNLPVPVVDGNVNRVIARIFGVHEPIDTPAGAKIIKEFAGKIIDKTDPSTHNQAIMEFGALQCTISNPDCGSCPLNKECYAFTHNEVNLLPIKIKRTKVRNRYFNYLVILCEKDTYLIKRQEKDIWHGLYEFPLIETDGEINQKELIKTDRWKSIFADNSYKIENVSATYKHLLSHQTIHAKFYLIKATKEPDVSECKFIKTSTSEIQQFPVSKLIDNYLSTLNW